MAGAGHDLGSNEVSWYKRDSLLFAASIGCTEDELHFLYEQHPKFAVFPTYAIILPFKRTDSEVVDFYKRNTPAKIPGIPDLDPRKVVDGGRVMQFLKPLPVSSEGRKFEVRSKVLGVYDKGKPGTVVETEQLLVDASSGDVYTRAVGQGFYVGQGNWGGPKGDKATAYNPPQGKQPDAQNTTPTDGTTALLYRLNGDYNPLHIDPEVGKKANFGGPIIHGLFTWNTAAHAVLKELGGSDPANLKEFQARFAAPVKPGDTLVTEMWRTGEKVDGNFEDVRFVTKVNGKPVLSNGRAVVRCVPKSKL